MKNLKSLILTILMNPIVVFPPGVRMATQNATKTKVMNYGINSVLIEKFREAEEKKKTWWDSKAM